MKAETKVGILFLMSFVLVVLFAYFLGALNPFSNQRELHLAYNFAGGLEVGSPVRVMGIKVGKVKAIEFMPEMKMPDGEEVKLKVIVGIDKKAWPTLRSDSRFYINLAGVIGEKFLEVTPGTLGAAPLESGQLVRGEDPPRIDQLISQSYGLAGKVLDMVEKNEGSVVSIIETLNKLVVNFDKALRTLDKTTRSEDMNRLVKNLIHISDDVAYLTKGLRGPDGQKTIALLNELIHRLEPMDAQAIRKFLQEEGIKARMF